MVASCRLVELGLIIVKVMVMEEFILTVGGKETVQLGFACVGVGVGVGVIVGGGEAVGFPELEGAGELDVVGDVMGGVGVW